MLKDSDRIKFGCHSRAGGNLYCRLHQADKEIPAYAGMTQEESYARR